MLILGDIQFSTHTDWRKEAAINFLDWLEGFVKTRDVSQEVLVQVGDLVEESALVGETICLVARFAQIVSAFKKVYILTGNHDWKMVGGSYQLAYKFIDNNNIEIVDRPREIEIQGTSCLFLPHYNGTRRFGRTAGGMADLYPKIKNDSYELIFGHFFDTTLLLFSMIELADDLKPIRKYFGHLHTRPHEMYTGSVHACKINEEDTELPRCIFEYRSGQASQIPLPIFVEFRDIKLGGEIEPSIQGKTVVYTILDCASEGLARELYPDIHIRKSTPPRKIAPSATEIKKTLGASPVDYFREWVAETSPNLKRGVAGLIVGLLEDVK